MPRVKHAPAGKARRKKILKAAKGNFNARGNLYKQAKLTVERGWAFAYAARRAKKRDFRGLWIMRISAAAKEQGISYSQFISGLKKQDIQLNRKVLADLAIRNPEAFSQLAQEAKAI